MAAQRRRSVAPAPSAWPPRKASLRLADGTEPARSSPALRQQDLVAAHWRAPDEDAPGRWSQRRTLAFIGLTCGGIWACVAIGAAELLR